MVHYMGGLSAKSNKLADLVELFSVLVNYNFYQWLQKLLYFSPETVLPLTAPDCTTGRQVSNQDHGLTISQSYSPLIYLSLASITSSKADLQNKVSRHFLRGNQQVTVWNTEHFKLWSAMFSFSCVGMLSSSGNLRSGSYWKYKI